MVSSLVHARYNAGEALLQLGVESLLLGSTRCKQPRNTQGKVLSENISLTTLAPLAPVRVPFLSTHAALGAPLLTCVSLEGVQFQQSRV